MNSKKIIIAEILIFLVVMLPFAIADSFEQQGTNVIIEAKKYEPEIVRSDYLEQINLPVRIILGAIRSVPISVPKIKTVHVELIKQADVQKIRQTQMASKASNISTKDTGTEPDVKGTDARVIKDYIQGTPKFYKASPPTLDNLGYIQITLKKIPRESEVPDQIDLDFKATITYEADLAAATIGGTNTLLLKQATVEEIKADKEKYSILGGRYYLRLVAVRDDKATVEILDPNFKRVKSVSLKEYQDAKDISSSIFLDKETEPNSIRLKLEEIEGAGIAQILFGDEMKSVRKGKDLGEGWKINYYSIQNGGEGYVRFSNRNYKVNLVLTTEDEFDDISKIEKILDSCNAQKLCKIYGDSSFSRINSESYDVEEVRKAIEALKKIGIKKLERMEESSAKRKAVFSVQGTVDEFIAGNPIGDSQCECEVSGVGTDRAYIKGNLQCDLQSPKIQSQSFSVGSRHLICGTTIELKSITSDQKVEVTVLPGTGQGKTETYFSVHIPVEKRAIQYTPEELSNKINETKEMIKKLDKIITQLETLVEGWTKICLATAALFTVMSFFRGMNTVDKKTDIGEGEEAEKSQSQDVKINIPMNLWYVDPSTGERMKLESSQTLHTRGGIVYWNSKEIGLTQMKFFTAKDGGDVYIIKGNELVKSNPLIGNFRSGADKISVSKDGNSVIVPLRDCSQLSSTNIQIRNKCRAYSKSLGSAMYLVYSVKDDYIDIWWGGTDGVLYLFKNGKNDGDLRIMSIDGRSTEGKNLKKDILKVRDSYQRGEKTFKFGGHKYSTGVNHVTPGEARKECSAVMSVSQCKLLFNACDPVMCPSSRCDFGGRYRVDNVIQSGLIGSLILCLPNIKDGVIMPVCLSGILAGLKNIRSILQGYVSCLQESLYNQKSVGVCDRIRSIFICQIIWKEAMTLLGLARGNLFDAAIARGGGEYIVGGIKGGMREAEKTLDYFTNDYARSVFSAYRGRSSKELGAIICEKAIYGKMPVVDELVNGVTEAQNQPQFTAYVEEQPLYSETAQESVYKLYYHIYAGSQQTTYKVYLKKGSSTRTCSECSGSIAKEGFVDKSVIFRGKPGYNEVCVIINGKQQCGFGRLVSSSFALSKVNDYWMQYELSRNIESESECRADTRGIVPHAQIQKVCSPMNPGIGKGNVEEQRWKKVGSCGKDSKGAFLGYCWARLGDLENTNPEAYRGTVMNLCEGKVCGYNQQCDGRSEITSVSGMQSVVCCYGECKEDNKITEAKSEMLGLSWIKSGSIYEDMAKEGLKQCEENSKYDPFSKQVTGWGAEEKAVEKEGKESDRYNQFYFFKGYLYLLCKNIVGARDAFEKMSEKHPLYVKACGSNKKGDGGLMYELSNNLCTDSTTEKKKEKKFKFVKLTLIDPKGKKIVLDNDKVELKFGGVYKVESIEFNKDLGSCELIVNGKTLTQEKISGKLCEFNSGDSKFLITTQKGKQLEIKGKSKDNKEEVTKEISINLMEPSVSNSALVCETAEKNKFCISNEGERCSDYQYTNEFIRAIYVEKSDKTLEGCKGEFCPGNPKNCLPQSHSYTIN